MLGSLARELGDPERITAWVRAFGMVNSAPGFASQPSVINGFSDLLLELFGEAGAHAPTTLLVDRGLLNGCGMGVSIAGRRYHPPSKLAGLTGGPADLAR